MSRCLGQGLSEYSIIGALIVLITVPALVLMGNNLKLSFNTLLPARKPTISIVQSPAPVAQPQGAGNVSAVPVPNQIHLITAKGSRILIQTESKPLNEVLRTAGANGATATLADRIRSIAEQLQAGGDITATQAGSLIALANQGHRLGAIMGLMEQAASNSRNNDEFDRTTVTFEGKHISIEKLENGLGFESMDYGEMPRDPLNMSLKPYKETGAFIEAYQKAQNQGAMDDPQIKNVVQGLASEIVMITVAMDNAQWASSAGDIKPITLLDHAASAITHADSGGICLNGKAKDSGIQCVE